tara:strand:+ start:417 stop:584 length:168 start_codon:yes stop_codon:yes gene_type:complete
MKRNRLLKELEVLNETIRVNNPKGEPISIYDNEKEMVELKGKQRIIQIIEELSKN